MGGLLHHCLEPSFQQLLCFKDTNLPDAWVYATPFDTPAIDPKSQQGGR